MAGIITRRTILTASALAAAGAWATIAAGAEDGSVRLILATPPGDITLELYPKRAPLSCAAFLACVDAHLYDGGKFTRVVRADNDRRKPRINVVQGAAATDLKTQKTIAHEGTRTTGLHHIDGALSLPRDGVGTATGAEFFICVGDNAGLDEGGTRNPDLAGYAVFGRVAAGMDAVRRIWTMDASGPSEDAVTKDQMLLHPVPINAIRRA